MAAPARLPGITFETAPRPLPVTLPRMDIAAFVGLATAGPLDLPVPVEDVIRFRDLFGPDLPLAWDPARGTVQHGYLGAAVEAFFRNGGRRAWVVRVAGPGIATQPVPIPGLFPLDPALSTLPPDQWPGAEARARSPGAWAKGLEVVALLRRQRLSLGRQAPPPLALATQGGASVYQLEVAGAPADTRVGDLIEVRFGAHDLALLLFADAIESRPRGLTLRALTGVWTTIRPLPEPSRPLPESAGLDAYAALASSPPDGVVSSAYRLRFELRVRQQDGAERRLTDLAFSSDHPRFWGHLPDDDDLFTPAPGRVVPIRDPLVQRLRQEVADPRFPLAGPVGDDGPRRDLPLAMPTVLSEVSDLVRLRPQIDPIANDGLERFGPELFLDPALEGIQSGALLAEAEHRYYLRERWDPSRRSPPQVGQRLRGIHSVLPIEEVTLLAVPDAAHRGWTRDPAPQKPPLGVPTLRPVSGPQEGGPREDELFDLKWTAVEGATDYRLRAADNADLDQAMVWDVAAVTGVSVPVAIGCTEVLFFQVRARRHGEVGAWSNARAVAVTPGDFTSCDQPDPARLELLLWQEPAGSPPDASDLLVQPDASNGLEPDRPDRIELQAASETDFQRPQRFALTDPDHGRFGPVSPDERTLYLRARAQRGAVLGPWSNTLALAATRRSAWTCIDIERLDAARAQLDVGGSGADPAAHAAASGPIAVHRALIRFAAARRDLLAVLSLPGHFRDQQALEHLEALLPPDPAHTQAGVRAIGGVPPLTFGERDVLSYAALYHPWLLVRASDDATDSTATRLVPPDGAIAGLIARRSLEQGAWIAPANEALRGPLALEPRIDLDARQRLVAAQINPIRPDPRGFVVDGADTLSRTQELRALNVRLLLILLRRLALREGATSVFEPNDVDFRDLVRRRFQRLLGEMYSRGAFTGARPEEGFRVVADESVNPPQAIERGRFMVELQVAPSRPLGFLTVRLVQTAPQELLVEEV